MARILYLTGAHLCMAPRPQKAAQALADAGHDVVVMGVWFDEQLARRDEVLTAGKLWSFEPVLDMRSSSSTSIGRFAVKARRKSGVVLQQKFGIGSANAFGYGAKEMLRAARKRRPDLTIVDSEGGLWVGAQLLDEGFRVGVDFIDWFSEDLLPEDRRGRPTDLLKSWEAKLAGNCRFSLAASQPMANAIAQAYGTPQPLVIHNVFPWENPNHFDHEKKDRANTGTVSVHWFSQTIGPGRGLEVSIEAMKKVRGAVELHLRGNLSAERRKWLASIVSSELDSRVFVHPTVPTGELLSRIAEHDIGLALETPEIPNRDLTVTNKFFQYLQGGLALIATRTKGQEEAFNRVPEVGCLVPPNDPDAVASAIHEFVENPEKLDRAKRAALTAAREVFTWEKEAPRLVALAKEALEDPR